MSNASRQVGIAKALPAKIALMMESLEETQRLIHEELQQPLRNTLVLKIISPTNNNEWVWSFSLISSRTIV